MNVWLFVFLDDVWGYTLFYKQHFYKQRQAEIDKKAKDTQYPETEISIKLSKSASEAILMRLYD